jgi:hypothetical protein
MPLKHHEYIYADDPCIGKRVIHVVIKGWAISLVTGHRFKYKKARVGK